MTTSGRMRRHLCAVLVILCAAAGCSKKTDGNTQRKESVQVAKKGVAAQSIPEGKNRLALEKSPYLLQHADNPVDWYPWGEEAFAKARTADKPIFLSIGYSTCHWCHVMEHESFEDSTVAAMLNDAFVCIKVDREERPDIDNVYMTVCQMLTGSGGWPLTIVMAPDGRPFYAATYIPKEDRYGRPGLISLIPQIKDVWKNQRADVLKASTDVAQQLQDYATNKGGSLDLGADALSAAFDQLKSKFDAENGGFGSAPKFPTPHNLLFLLRYWKRSGNPTALEMVTKTLNAMAAGGMYDQIGFGFHRYSTDTRWFAPHFEKMLYDQALLLMAYSEAYAATGNEDYRRIAGEIVAYVTRDMTDPRGAFYSAEDADSEGLEGKFYLWTEAQLRDVLSKDDADLAVDVYGVEPEGNFAAEVPTGNILFQAKSLADIAAQRNLSEADLRTRIESIRSALFAAREKRVHPHKDDKILTDWNGLMIAALSVASRIFHEPGYARDADRAAAFLLDTMRSKNGGLLHRYRDGEAAIAANVDDYAFFVWGLIELYETTFDVKRLEAAIALNKAQIEGFWDEEGGGFYFSADKGSQLIVRMKEVYDGAIPSGNSVSMLNLLLLARMTGDTALEGRASALGRAFSDDVTKAPAVFTCLLTGVNFSVGPTYEVVVVGDPSAGETRAMLDTLAGAYVPNKVVLFKPAREKHPRIEAIAPYTKAQAAVNDRVTVYVCRNYACDLPTNDPEKMLQLLGAAP